MWDHLKSKNIKLPKITSEEIDEQVALVLRDMEKVGIKLDVPFLEKISKDVEKRLIELEKKVCDLAGSQFNLNSPSQMADVLYSKLKLSTEDLKRTKSGFSTAAGELRKLEEKHKIIKPILEYRELSKLLSTYLLPLPKMVDSEQRLHTTYGQDTTTGRLTSSDPNLQNIPIRGERGSEIRKAFIADPGKILISADYSQIELRIVACLSEDQAMVDAFSSGQDIHSRTAAEIFNVRQDKVTPDQRRVAKVVNFGVLYGMSPYGLSQALGIDQGDAAKFIDKYFAAHSGIEVYCNRMIQFAKTEGYVETLFGFKRKLTNINSHFRNLAESEKRMAINTPVQGSAAEVLKLAMINLHRELEKIRKKDQIFPRLLLTIHDELILEADKKDSPVLAKLLKETMESAIGLCVPLEVEVKMGQSWGEMTKISN